MSMILFAMVWKPDLGLTLAETMDGHSGKDIRAIKILMKNFFREQYERKPLPTRCTLQLPDCNIHMMTETDLPVAWTVVTQPMCPPVLAFGFLEEIQGEFTTQFSPSQVIAARRADTFIHFSTVLAKVRQRYNNPRSPNLRISLPNLSHKLQHTPPAIFNMTNGISSSPRQNNSSASSTDDTRWVYCNLQYCCTGSILHLLPSLSVLLSVLAAMLSLYRGFADLSQHNVEEMDVSSPLHGVLFLLEGVLNMAQAGMVWFDLARWRKKTAILLLLALVAATLLLNDTRDPWQSGLHLTIAVLSALSGLVLRNTLRPPHRPKLEV